MQPITSIGALPSLQPFDAAGAIARGYAGPSFASLLEKARAARQVEVAPQPASPTPLAVAANVAQIDWMHAAQRAEAAYQAVFQLTEHVAQTYRQITDIRI